MEMIPANLYADIYFNYGVKLKTALQIVCWEHSYQGEDPAVLA